MRRLRSCLLQLAITIGSASLIGIAWLGIILWDPFHRWQPLPPSPVAIASIVDIRHTIITIRAADEQLYTIDPDRDQAWMLITSLPTDKESSVAQITFGPCDRSDQRFAWYRGIPANTQACFEGNTQYIDGSTTLSVLQQNDQQLFYYASGGSSFVLPFIPLGMIFACLVFGYCITRIILG